ncbi:T9SS type A sorting domain-containing protein [Hymenobacter sp. ASUV-10]|uniref:T9SS type A sorting domain-containing protein n=1 Tax=Hymenobacter aranciens TaxID=3063996 RepID=A0ABT9BA55_9BACT|nr:T9SS type A sorting domain-containing protein [Hymenobacter sp. ASUV-10]MDO7875152.1 T9SS type A sorting domain-containing protein [Hymenobacter sp. ASUV-10]
MKLLHRLLLLLCLLGWYSPASAQLVEWARLARNQGDNSGFAGGGTTDAAGNTYVGIVFKDSARIGNQTLRAVFGPQAIVKYDSTGQVSWVKQLNNTFLDARGLNVDPANGGVFVTGRFSNAPSWGGAPVAGGGNRNFYGKINAATGALSWTNSLPRQLNVYTSSAADGRGNFYLFSEIDSVITIGGLRLDSTSTFVLGARADGTGQWMNPLRGVPAGGQFGLNGRPYSGIYSNTGLAPRPTGGCVVHGMAIISLFYGASVVPTPVLTTNPAAYLDFMLEVSPTGTPVQARPGFTAAVPVPQRRDLTIDSVGNYYITGSVNSTIGIGVAKYSPTGTLVWVTNQEPTVGGLPGATGEKIMVHPNGEVTIQAYTALIAGRSPTTIGTLILRSENNLVRYSASGQPLWAVGDGTSNQYATSPTDYGFAQSVAFGADRHGNIYWALEATTSSTTGPGGFSTTPPATRLGAFTLVGAGVAVARIGTHHNTIRGTLYLDQNGNGSYDTADLPFPQTVVMNATQATLNSFGSTDVAGEYVTYTGTGAYTLPLPVPPKHYTISQPTTGPYTGNFTGFGNVDAGRDFGFRPVANQADVRVVLTPYGAVRPGFVARYRVTLENVGTTTASGSVAVVLDSHLSYVASAPSGSRTNQTVTWTYSNLAPLSRRDFDLSFSLPVNAVLGTAISSTATAPLSGDVEPSDNSSATAQTVTGSFDPNDIAVNYSRLSPAQIAAGQPLDYTIRFQNMGTDTAFTVVISDTLDFHKLNLSTMQLVAQSHNCIWSLTGTGLLTVRFLSIKLPHRTADVIRSQGFVRFRVQPRPTLAVGEIIPNRAHIFFDYNAPVTTNTATTAVLLPSAVLNTRPALAWSSYPNPATEALTIEAELPTAGLVQLQLLDVLGRPVQQRQLPTPAGAFRQTLDLGAQAPGLYVLRLTLPDGRSSTRPVQRK